MSKMLSMGGLLAAHFCSSPICRYRTLNPDSQKGPYNWQTLLNLISQSSAFQCTPFIRTNASHGAPHPSILTPYQANPLDRSVYCRTEQTVIQAPIGQELYTGSPQNNALFCPSIHFKCLSPFSLTKNGNLWVENDNWFTRYIFPTPYIRLKSSQIALKYIYIYIYI